MILVKKNILLNKYFLIVLIGTIVTLPINLKGVFTGHDFVIHFKWSYLFAEQLFNGDLYPKWLARDFSGYGSPVFYYYGPVPFYFSAFFYYFFDSFTPLWFPITFAASFSIVASGLMAYKWLKSFSSERASIIGGIIYMILPYHLGIDLFTRFAYAECWAFVWMPAILLYSGKIAKGNILAGSIGVSFFLALLLMTHLPSALIFLPVPLCYVFYHTKKIKSLAAIIFSYLLGFGISAIYWIPAVSYQKYVNFNALLEYFWRDNFLFTNPQNIHTTLPLWYYLNIITIISLIIWILIQREIQFLKSHDKKEYYFWLIIFLWTFLMVTPLSIPIWLVFKPIQIIGFPWRFLSLFSLSFVGLASIYLTQKETTFTILKNQWPRFFCVLLILVALMVTSNLLFIYKKVSDSYTFVSHTNISHLREALISKFEPAEHIPAMAKTDKLALTRRSKMVESVQGDCELWALTDKPGHIEFEALSKTTSSTVRINQFYYPGWTLNATSENLPELELKINPENGLMYLVLPKGHHSITIKLEELAVEYYSEIISIISILILLSGFLFKFSNSS